MAKRPAVQLDRLLGRMKKRSDGRVSLTIDRIADALAELATYDNIDFGTIVGKFKVKGDCITILAIENLELHNGDFAKYIESIKVTYKVVLIQQVLNDRLRRWLIRNDFQVTAKSKANLVWRG